jgi:Co/Zn/Cd efflux system component
MDTITRIVTHMNTELQVRIKTCVPPMFMCWSMTSVMAIAALILARVYGWLWLDPAIGIVGAIVLANCSWGLLRDAGGVLLDYVPEGEDLPKEMKEVMVTEGAEIVNLHI